LLGKEERERVKRFDDWLLLSVREVENEKKKNINFQRSSSPSWIFDIPEFNSWVNLVNVDTRTNAPDTDNIYTAQECRTLWLSGTTGFGKSVLAAYAANELERMFPSTPVTYFFCKDNKFLREPHQIVRTFLYQATVKHLEARAIGREIWEGKMEFGEVPEIEELFNTLVVKVLENLSERVNTIFFIIDGINECPQNYLEGILTFLKLLQTIENPTICTLVTCQPTSVIVDALKHSVKRELHEGDNAENIKVYIENQFASNPVLLQQFDYVGIPPFDFFREHHKGMFLWVSSVLKYLQIHADSDEDFKRILSEVPNTITGLYRESLKRLEHSLTEKQKIWVREIFAWVVVAKRNLSAAELEVGLSFTHSDRKAQLWNIQHTLSRCGAFFQITSLPSETGQIKVVRLVHDSFKLFVTNRSECDSIFFVDQPTAHSTVARACMFYLSHQEISRHDEIYSPNKVRRQLEKDHRLFSYASQYWSTHLLETQHWVDVDGNLELREAVLEFCKYENFSTWIKSILAYSRQSNYWFSDGSHLKSVVPSIENLINWVSAQKPELPTPSEGYELWTKLLLSRQPYRNRVSWLRYVGQLIGKVWLTGDPEYVVEAFAAVLIIRDMLQKINQEGNQSVSVLKWVRAESLDKTARWYANIGHFHQMDSTKASELNAAITAYYQCLKHTDDPRIQTPVYFEICKCYRWIYYLGREPADLDKSIEAATTGINVILPDRVPAEYVQNLANSLQLRFCLTQSPVDLNATINFRRQAVALTPEEHPAFAARVHNLLVAIGFGYEIDTFPTNTVNVTVDEVIEMGRTAVSLTREDHPNFSARTFYLARELKRKFELSEHVEPFHRLKALDEAVGWMKRSVEAMAPHQPGFMDCMDGLRMLVDRRAYYHVELQSLSPTYFPDDEASERQQLATLYFRTNLLHPSAHIFHADAHWWLGDFDVSVTAYETALGQHQSHPKKKNPVNLIHDADCQICHTRLIGVRYKCKSCFHYNLCSGCIADGRVQHTPEHEFLSIPRTGTSWSHKSQQ